MKAIITILVLFASISYAATIRVSACTRDVCTEYILPDVRTYGMLKNPTGIPFLRAVFLDGRVLDISGDNIKVSR